LLGGWGTSALADGYVSPYNLDKFSKLTYALPCHYDSCHDKIVEWLEDSYIKKSQGNGNIMLSLFLNDDYEGKYDIFLSFFDILPFVLVIFDFVSIAGLELLRWLHWKHDFT
jgi:hypothetical protein